MDVKEFETERAATSFTPPKKTLFRGRLTPLKTCLAAIAMMTLAPLSSARAETPEILVPTKMQFDYGFFNDAVRMVDELLKMKLLADRDELVQAWELRGLACLYQGKIDEARESFLNLLLISPDFKLDTLTVSPDAIHILESEREAHREKLDPIREKLRALQDQERQLSAQNPPKISKELQRTILLRRADKIPFMTTFLPFGGAQFVQGRPGVGVVFAVTQGMAIAGSIVTWGVFQSKITSTGRVQPGELASAKAWRTANWAFFGASMGLFVGGIADAIAHHQSEVVTEVEIMDVSPEQNAIPESTLAPRQTAKSAGPTFFIAPVSGGGAAGISGTF